MASQRKCKICQNLIALKDYDTCVKYKSGYAHEWCFNDSISLIKSEADKQREQKVQQAVTRKKTTRKAADVTESKAKPKVALKGPVSEEEYQKKKSLYDYILSYYNEDGKLPVKVYALIEKYIEQYGFTYESLHQTLIYIREIKEKDIKDDGIGLTPYYKEEAEAYYKSVKQVEETNKDVDVSKMYNEKTVIINPRKRVPKQLDITSIK